MQGLVVAESAGKIFGKVRAGTTQRCSNCHEIVRKGITVRTHICPSCGLKLNRDYNAAINIDKLGLDMLRESKCMPVEIMTALSAKQEKRMSEMTGGHPVYDRW